MGELKEEVPKRMEQPKEQRRTKSRSKSENKDESRKLSARRAELVTHFPEASDVRSTHMSMRWKALSKIYVMVFCWIFADSEWLSAAANQVSKHMSEKVAWA